MHRKRLIGGTMMALGVACVLWHWSSQPQTDPSHRPNALSAPPVAVVATAGSVQLPSPSPEREAAPAIGPTVLVLDSESKRPVLGATLSDAGGRRIATTEADGQVTVPDGTEFVVAFHPAYVPSFVRVDPLAATGLVTIHLTRGASLEGAVFDQDGHPVAGAVVVVRSGPIGSPLPEGWDPDESEPDAVLVSTSSGDRQTLAYRRMAHTDAAGQWRVEGLATQTHQVEASKYGFVVGGRARTNSLEVAVTANGQRCEPVTLCRIFVAGIEAESSVPTDQFRKYLQCCVGVGMSLPPGSMNPGYLQRAPMADVARFMVGDSRKNILPLSFVAGLNSNLPSVVDVQVSTNMLGEVAKLVVPFLPLDTWAPANAVKMKVTGVPDPCDVVMPRAPEGVEVCLRWSAVSASPKWSHVFQSVGEDSGGIRYLAPPGVVAFAPRYDMFLAPESAWRIVRPVERTGPVRGEYGSDDLPRLEVVVEGGTTSYRRSCFVQVCRVLDDGREIAPVTLPMQKRQRHVLACERGTYKCVLYDDRFRKLLEVVSTHPNGEPIHLVRLQVVN